jgi:aryl-phospho-beta-D-glucosidase BglC (GH1 family)
MFLKKALQFLLLLVIVAVSITFVVEQHRPSSAATGIVFPHVSGTKLIDSSGQTFLLHGANIESAFMYANSWFKNNNATKVLNPKVFNEMSQVWHMNAVRICLSNWIYDKDPTHYLGLLDQIVQQANQAGLYVILNLHDDDQAGSPYGSGADAPKPESVAFWKVFAAHYKSNAKVMFDAYNEPHYPDGKTWLKGGGTQVGSTGKSTQIVGMQALVDAIRATGAKQIIIIGGLKYPVLYAKKYQVAYHIDDANIVYTKHPYHQISEGTPTTWDEMWGYFKGTYPLYTGEWALLPNTKIPVQCKGATMQNANQLVAKFLNYMDQNKISWTAWQFDIPHLILNLTNFTPTQLDDPQHPWKCNSPGALAGMGQVVKQHLLSY